MKKVLWFLCGTFITLGLFSACNKKDDTNPESKDAMYYLKSMKKIDGKDNSIIKEETYVYKDKKLTQVLTNMYDETFNTTYTYSSDKIIRQDVDYGETTMETNNNIVISRKNKNEDFSYTYESNFLSTISGILDNTCFWKELYKYVDGNLISFQLFDDDNLDEECSFEYSNIVNKTNVDFGNFLYNEDETCSFSQFIGNVSKNIPIKVSTDYGGSSDITISLDSKGRPTKIVFDGDEYEFEYYENF